ncbi:MAG: hypothetical protein KDB07_06250 [Planctomycetes bacterium]|nr:hypothetical protein [Planctomycetota bacterium]
MAAMKFPIKKAGERVKWEPLFVATHTPPEPRLDAQLFGLKVILTVTQPEDTMDKYAVVVDDNKEPREKTAADKSCPRCGRALDPASSVPRCPNCGTAPFEKERRRRDG